jgi:hypothetical protein
MKIHQKLYKKTLEIISQVYFFLRFESHLVKFQLTYERKFLDDFDNCHFDNTVTRETVNITLFIKLSL